MGDFQPSGVDQVSFTYDGLIAGSGLLQALQVTLAQIAGFNAVVVRGTLLAIDEATLVDGRPTAHALATVKVSETAESLGALVSAQAAYSDALAFKAIVPGTVVLKRAGTEIAKDTQEDGVMHDTGASALSGRIDYATGEMTYIFAADAGNTDAMTVDYDHHDGVSTRVVGLVKAILAEDVTEAAIEAGAVKTLAYTSGKFNVSALTAYEKGYEVILKRHGIDLQRVINPL